MRAAVQSIRPLSHPSGFGLPDFSSPLDLQTYVRRVPPKATAKGMFISRLMAELDRRGIARPTSERFLPFSDYSLRRCLELNFQCAQLLYPQHTTREGLRRVAWLSFETFSSSLVGNVLFGAVGRDVGAICRLAARGLGYTTNVGRYEVEAVGNNAVMMHASDAFCFAEPFGVGMVEGVLRSCGTTGEVLVSMHTPSDGVFYVRWE